jgi:predicted dehydrogenase
MITLGLIGTGWWGRMLLDAAAGSPALRFVHACSRRGDTGAPVAEKHGLRFSTEVAAMLADPEVQAVVIATPHSTHLPLIRQAAAAGKPVFCEKPLTLAVEEARAAYAACRAAGVPLAVGHNRRFLPTVEAMRRLVADGVLGRLLHIEGHSSNENSSSNFAPWRSDPAESPAGGLTGTGVHVLDVFSALAGPASRVVSASVHQVKPPPGPLDSLVVSLEFAAGLTGTLAAVRATPRYWRIHLFGEAGNAETWGDAAGDTEVILRRRGVPAEILEFGAVDTLRAELEAFAAALSGGPAYPITEAEMLATVGMTEAIIRSVAAGGPAVTV